MSKKVYLPVRVSQGLSDKIDSYVQTGDYSSRSEFAEVSIRYYLDYLVKRDGWEERRSREITSEGVCDVSFNSD